ncbi:hypothetical protein H6P81_014454 [Aristolochia fimbriata]|uniref:Uncharacterized protein n=1 Tax=Aristolochia fimbriata TaxID=158543 RepID=A0AAV7EIR5_ARIFI|nr:hypothetical protein H6P81_014454 [Aristolochia fimbriata]
MAEKLALGFCVIVSVFLFASARHLPLKEETTEKSLSGFTVLPLRHKTPLRIRFPYRNCHHHLRLPGPRVVSYGNDMLSADAFDQRRLFRSRVSTFRGFPLKPDSGFPTDRHFRPDLEPRLIPETRASLGTAAWLQTDEANEPRMERGEEALGVPEGGFKKWFADILEAVIPVSPSSYPRDQTPTIGVFGQGSERSPKWVLSE